MAFSIVASSAVLAQETTQEIIYVSAKGDGLGWSEADPTNFSMALTKVKTGHVKKIMIIGVLDIHSNGMNIVEGVVFDFENMVLGEIVITGKPGVSGAERAVLSAKGSGKIPVFVHNCHIRFEHIEISGGEGRDGHGLFINNAAQVTLGPGTIVRNNVGRGIVIANGARCIIEGGEIHNNNGGVMVLDGRLTLRNGSIRDNISSGHGGGVLIGKGSFTMSGGSITNNRTAAISGYGGGGVYIGGGNFTMSGGSISNNRAQAQGGGVCVRTGGIFDQNSGTINSNFAGQGSNPNVYRE